MDRLYSDYDNLTHSYSSKSVKSNSSGSNNRSQFDCLTNIDINNNNNSSSDKSTSSSSCNNQPHQSTSKQRIHHHYPSSCSSLGEIANELFNESGDGDNCRSSLISRRFNSDNLDDLSDVPLELAREDIEMVVDVYIWFEKVRTFLLGLLC